ncbi:hypothetical protein AMTRI_Chr11g150590 [Amborella trichopoda]
MGDTPQSKPRTKLKLFRVNMKLASKVDGQDLERFLRDKDHEEEEDANYNVPLPQDYLHALNVVLRKNPVETCIPVGRSLYSSSIGEGAKGIGEGAICLRGLFQSLRPTKQGLALNVDFSVAAFHESISIIQFLQKRCEFLRDLSQRKSPGLVGEERRELENALRNIRVFVSHRVTDQRYKVFSLTAESTENLRFKSRGGANISLVDYFKENYNHDIQFQKLPCLQMSRSKPSYVPMGALRHLGNMAKDFKLHISRDMTRFTGRVLQPPKLKLGDAGQVTDLIPTRHDCQWNLLESHVLQGARIERWAIISFRGTPEQRSSLPKFIIQLAHHCQQLGVALNKVPTCLVSRIEASEDPRISIQSPSAPCLHHGEEHRGYTDLKRISEMSISIVSQCCLYQNLMIQGSQFLANLALKINAKTGGCTSHIHGGGCHPHPPSQRSQPLGSMNWPSPNKYASRMWSQTHNQEIIEDLGQMVEELLLDFYREVNKMPKRILFFRDGVSETQFYTLNNQPKGASYNPAITFVVVQKQHHTRRFQATTNPQGLHSVDNNNNIPPGTVGTMGTSRPTHYHVLWDENCFSSDELQKLIYNLCFTSTRCTKPISLVAPAYYPPPLNGGGSGCLSPDYSASFTPSRAGPPPQAAPLPRLAGNLKNLMFYC